MLNFEVYYKSIGGNEMLRAAFATRYEAEKYIEEWHKPDITRFFIKVKKAVYGQEVIIQLLD